MGKYNQGILGAFYGKVGTVVGSSWRGITYMRSLTRKRGNTNATDKQLEQQARFALITSFLNPIKPILEIGFKSYAVGKTGFNSAHSYNLKNALSGTLPNLTIDYSMLLVSRGDLPPAAALTAASNTAGKLTLSWTDNTGKGKAKANDQLMVVMFCPSLEETTYEMTVVTRADQTIDLDLPIEFSGESVELYTFWVSADLKEVATSKYVGSVLIQ